MRLLIQLILSLIITITVYTNAFPLCERECVFYIQKCGKIFTYYKIQDKVEIYFIKVRGSKCG